MAVRALDGWNHNIHYHPELLRAVPRPCLRALDAGCGLGAFARRLARVAAVVDAIDRDAVVVARARELSAGTPNLRLTHADFLTWPESSYDFVSLVATLHHLPFVEALTKAASLLRPNGVLAVLGLHRNASVFDLAPNVVVFPVSLCRRLVHGASEVGAPTRDPTMTLTEIRTEAAAALPGAVFRRHLLWRYSVIWSKGPDRLESRCPGSP